MLCFAFKSTDNFEIEILSVPVIAPYLDFYMYNCDVNGKKIF